MTRLSAALLLLAVSCPAGSLLAAPPLEPIPVPAPQQAPQFPQQPCEPQAPLGFGKSGYGVRLKYHMPNGSVKYRYTYPGYANGFPPPAFLYYGYPQSGFSYGPGF